VKRIHAMRFSPPEEEITKEEIARRYSEIAAQKQERTCLMCGTTFISTWSGHRRCDRCSRRTEKSGVSGKTFPQPTPEPN